MKSKPIANKAKRKKPLFNKDGEIDPESLKDALHTLSKYANLLETRRYLICA